MIALSARPRHASRRSIAPHPRLRPWIALVGLAFLGRSTLRATDALGQPFPAQPGGGFGVAYPNFTGAPGMLSAEHYVQLFNAGYHTSSAYAYWMSIGSDIRQLNPTGVYLKHLNLRVAPYSFGVPAMGSPAHEVVASNNPEWIIKDRFGTPASMFGWREALDFGRDADLDWALDVWMPGQYLHATDADPNRITWHMHDNGDCGAGTSPARSRT